MSATWVLGLGLGIAFSPAVFDLGAHWIEHPWSRYSAVFLPLLVWCAWREPEPVSRRPLGIAAIALGLALQLLAALSVMPALGRPGLALAIAGFLLVRGLASPACAALAIFIVPVPHTLTDFLGGDVLAPELLRAGSRLLRLVGVTIAAGTEEVVAGRAMLKVDSSQAGLPILFAMVGLGWYAMQRGAALSRWLPALLAGGAVAHFAGILLAELALVAGSARASAFLVDTFGWLVPTIVLVWRLEAPVRDE